MLAESWDFRTRAKGGIVSQRTENSVVRLGGYQRHGACGIDVVSGFVPGWKKGGRRAHRKRAHFGNVPIAEKGGRVRSSIAATRSDSLWSSWNIGDSEVPRQGEVSSRGGLGLTAGLVATSSLS